MPLPIILPLSSRNIIYSLDGFVSATFISRIIAYMPMAFGYYGINGINNGSRNSVTGDKERPRKHVDAEYIIATYP